MIRLFDSHCLRQYFRYRRSLLVYCRAAALFFVIIAFDMPAPFAIIQMPLRYFRRLLLRCFCHFSLDYFRVDIR